MKRWRREMDKFIEFLTGFNIQTILSLVAIVWYFSHNVKTEMRVLEGKMDAQAARTDRLYEMFIDLLKEKNNVQR
jgi:hypothetical protein